jgi:LPS-assembly lipoprotein
LSEEHSVRIAAIILLGLLTAACGFHLRGEAKLPFRTLYLDMPSNSTLAIALKRAIVAGTNTRLVKNATEAQAIFSVLSEDRSKVVLSYGPGGQVAELRLRYRVGFRVHDAKGRDYVRASEIRLRRDISYASSQLLQKESEEALQYRDMESDMVQQIMRRLAAAPAEPSVVEPKADHATAG